MDYRPALRNRSGVGEYAHQLAAALLRLPTVAKPGGEGEQLELTLFSSSWKDRLAIGPELARARTVDARLPVALLNFAWHRLEFPAVERLAGGWYDVAHSPHPLLLPSRGAAQVVTIHDLSFLSHPERTRAEIRRDYPVLARAHARRADHVIVPSRFAAREVERDLGVAAERITICPPGAPDWPSRPSAPANGYILFFGTLEPRKNLGALLDAYAALLTRAGARPVPDLVLAGRATPDGSEWLRRIQEAPLAGRVRHIGYVDPADRRSLYEGARLLVHPSYEEGFGMTVLEAMTVGVPVVASDRGALPELLEDAGVMVSPENSAGLADAIRHLLDDEPFAAALAAKGKQRAGRYGWSDTAQRVVGAYRAAIERRACASA